MPPDTRITFIGAGNMATSLIGSLLRNGFDATHIRIADPSNTQLQRLRKKFPVHTDTDNLGAVQAAQVVVFAVKPQVFRETARHLAMSLSKTRPLVISIAAGIAEPDIRRWLGYEAAIVRVMPNTPALIGAGVAALYANRFVSAEQHGMATSMLQAVGLAVWVDDEKYMDTVTALSGSGPAYFFLVMEAMEDAARALGLPTDIARQLGQQTAYGAARMALESRDAASALRKQVTSPGGTTAAALEVLEAAKLREIFLQALSAARDRGAALSREFGRDS